MRHTEAPEGMGHKLDHAHMCTRAHSPRMRLRSAQLKPSSAYELGIWSSDSQPATRSAVHCANIKRGELGCNYNL
jgi:hypothetical protein